MTSLRRTLELKLYLEGVATAAPAVKYLESIRDDLLSARGISSASQDNEFIERITDGINGCISKIPGVIDPISEKIKELERRIDLNGSTLFNNKSLDGLWGSPEEIKRQRTIPIPSHIEESIRQKIWLGTSWQWPCLDLGARDGYWTQYMAAADLVYVADILPEFLTLTSEKLPVEFAKKLKKYIIYGHELSKLPKEQFGFIFSWAFMNFCSPFTVKRYLEQVKELLAPGGKFLFTYNNADLLLGMEFAEQGFRSFTPRRHILQWIEELGFDVTADEPGNSEVSWLEVKKPGRLSTIKYHPTRGEVNRKSP